MEVHNYSRLLFSITDTSYQPDAQHKPPLTPLKHTFWEIVMHKRDKVESFSPLQPCSVQHRKLKWVVLMVWKLHSSSRLYCTAVLREPTLLPI